MKISIVTVTYNSAATLRHTLESVLSQTFVKALGESGNDFEHIIIDGVSTDGTVDVIREYEPRYVGRLRWISEPDTGIYDAMNKGVAMATGDVIGTLNSDDFYTTTRILDTVAETFTADGVDAVYADVHYVENKNPDRCVRFYSSRNFRRWRMRLGFMPAHPSFYCRREVYGRCGMYDPSFKIAADFEWLLRVIFVERVSCRYIHRDFVTMRLGGVSNSNLQSHRRIWKEHRRAYRKNGVYSNFLLEGCRYLMRAYGIVKYRLVAGALNRRILREKAEARP